MSKDKRLHNRIDVNWSARIGGRGLGIAQARVKDASLSGMYLVTTLKIETSGVVIVELDFPGASRSALIHSKVVRKDPLVPGKLFGYGIQFLRLDDDILGYLLQACS